MRPRLLDLYCGAGGAAMGYHRAGFDVVGVDIAPQPSYPFEFHQADALEYMRALDPGPLQYRFWAIHASPPCQHYAAVTRWRGQAENHADLVATTRELLETVALPYVIENVREAGLENPLLLCGSMFGLQVRRHRHFETNWLPHPMSPFSCRHDHALPFEHKGERAYADAMGCEWMTAREGREAIPPAYTEYIGEQLLHHLERAAA